MLQSFLALLCVGGCPDRLFDRTEPRSLGSPLEPVRYELVMRTSCSVPATEMRIDVEQAALGRDSATGDHNPVAGPANIRPPKDDADLRYWLENMFWHHRFTPAEIATATGFSLREVELALQRFNISDATRPKPTGDQLRVLPYPGGRHPRTGFLDGAVNPQRETKVSIFTPWDEASYVVADVPEAVWSNLGLIYLAHTHVPTVWSEQQIVLPPLEWNRRADGSLDIERELPNKIVFGAKVAPGRDAVRFELWLRNGTSETLTDLRVQNCVMLKAAAGFSAQTRQNKRLAPPFAMVRSDDGQRWIITAWEPCHRAWDNPPVPCIHSDPQFPDCAPGETQRLRGWLWFYEGADIDRELERLRSELRRTH